MPEIILNDSPEAAQYVKNIEGWVANDMFYGKNEDVARYAGCTHKKCDCGEVMEKMYTKCAECRERAAVERHNKREKKKWDGETPLYSQAADEYFFDEDELLSHLEEYGCTAQSLRLVICKPVMLSTIDTDYWEGELLEDGELSDAALKALDDFNAVLRDEGPVSWEPGKNAVNCEGLL